MAGTTTSQGRATPPPFPTPPPPTHLRRLAYLMFRPASKAPRIACWALRIWEESTLHGALRRYGVGAEQRGWPPLDAPAHWSRRSLRGGGWIVDWQWDIVRVEWRRYCSRYGWGLLEKALSTVVEEVRVSTLGSTADKRDRYSTAAAGGIDESGFRLLLHQNKTSH